jgi:hypothetical protein
MVKGKRTRGHIAIYKTLLLVIVLFVLLQVMVSDYPFGIFKFLIIALSVLQVMASDYPFGIFKLLIIVLEEGQTIQ